MKYKFIALSSCRQTGKDTFCQLLQELNPNVKRVSLADELRRHVDYLSRNFFNKGAAHLDGAEKELFRPVLIEVGRLARTLNVDYWCKELYEQIEIYDSLTAYKDAVYCLTDMRYFNEYQYFKKIYGDFMFLINITREGAPDPTEEEKIHGPEVAKVANHHLHWKTDQSLESLRPIVKEIYEKFLKTA